MKNRVLQLILKMKRERGEPIWLDELLIEYAEQFRRPAEEVLQVLEELERKGIIYTRKEGFLIYTTKRAYKMRSLLEYLQ